MANFSDVCVADRVANFSADKVANFNAAMPTMVASTTGLDRGQVLEHQVRDLQEDVRLLREELAEHQVRDLQEDVRSLREELAELKVRELKEDVRSLREELAELKTWMRYDEDNVDDDGRPYGLRLL